MADYAAKWLRPWLPEPETSDVVYANVNLVDPKAGQVHQGAAFRVQNGTITGVWTANKDVPQFENDTRRVDLGGKYVCPGLIDCHVHLTASPAVPISEIYSLENNMIAYRTAYLAKEMLLRGFTTVRDCGGADAALRDAIAEGLVKGPRLLISGKALSQTGGHGDYRARHQGVEHKCCGGHAPGMGRVCDGVPQCLEAVRDELRKGADFIKITVGGGIATEADPIGMLQFMPEEIRAITQTAGYLGKIVTAHAYTPEAIRHAVDNGVRGIEHGNFIDKPTAEYCKEKGVVVTPTLITYQGYEQMTTPPFDTLLNPPGRIKLKGVLASGMDSLRILHEAGVTMCYGSDLLGVLQPMQRGEFTLRGSVLPAAEVLRSATTTAAEYVGMGDVLGQVKVGALADFLILEGNPLEDITVLDRERSDGSDNLLAVVKEGRVVTSSLAGLSPHAFYNSRAGA